MKPGIIRICCLLGTLVLLLCCFACASAGETSTESMTSSAETASAIDAEQAEKETIQPDAAAVTDPADTAAGYVEEGATVRYLTEKERYYIRESMVCLDENGLAVAVKDKISLYNEDDTASITEFHNRYDNEITIDGSTVYALWSAAEVKEVFGGMDAAATEEYLAARQSSAGFNGYVSLLISGVLYEANDLTVYLDEVRVFPGKYAMLIFTVINDSERPQSVLLTDIALDGCLIDMDTDAQCTVDMHESRSFAVGSGAPSDGVFDALSLENARSIRTRLRVTENGETQTVVSPTLVRDDGTEGEGVIMPQGDLLLEENGIRVSRLSFDADTGTALLCIERIKGTYKTIRLSTVYDGIRALNVRSLTLQNGEYVIVKLFAAKDGIGYGLTSISGMEIRLAAIYGDRIRTLTPIVLGTPAQSDAKLVSGVGETLFECDQYILRNAGTINVSGKTALQIECQNLTDASLFVYGRDITADGQIYNTRTVSMECSPHARSLVTIIPNDDSMRLALKQEITLSLTVYRLDMQNLRAVKKIEQVLLKIF